MPLNSTPERALKGLFIPARGKFLFHFGRVIPFIRNDFNTVRFIIYFAVCTPCKVYYKSFVSTNLNYSENILSRLGIFGSYARGEATEKSDIGIAVDISGPMRLNFVAMAEEIEALFGIKTDVVPSRSIKAEYLPFVEKDIIYA